MTDSAFGNLMEDYFKNNRKFDDTTRAYHPERLIFKGNDGSVAATSDEEATYVVYKITMKYPLENPRQSSSDLTVSGTASATAATESFTGGQQGLNGKWLLQIQCPGASERTDTNLLNHNARWWEVRNQIWEACPDYFYKVSVKRKEIFN